MRRVTRLVAGRKPEVRRLIDRRHLTNMHAGTLKPLYPVASDDVPTDGVKGQIFGANNVIVGRLIPAGTGLAYHLARKNAPPPASLFEDAPEAETPEPDP